MKLFVVAAVLGVCVADRLDNKYLPPRGNAGAGGFGPGFGAAGAPKSGGFGGPARAPGYAGAGSGFGAAPAGFGQAPAYSGNAYNAPASSYGAPAGGRSNPADANAQILKQNSEVTADGFSYEYETSNGIRADASGVATNGVQSQGSFSYKGDDGQDYTITYTADENGFVPQGAHLPTPPPIPEEILRSLEQNARDEAAGIVDDGTYRGEGAGAGNGYAGAGNGGYNAAAGNGYAAPGAGAVGGRPFGGSNFGAATSRQYLTPNTAQRGSGNGNYNAQSGYRY